MFKILNDNLYRIYYRIYYLFYSKKRINNPNPVTPPTTAVRCLSELKNQGKHNSFLYAPVIPLKWRFWKRRFAFKIIGDSTWYELPSLTPWSVDNYTNNTKYGLNSSFVQKWSKKELEFITWIN